MCHFFLGIGVLELDLLADEVVVADERFFYLIEVGHDLFLIALECLDRTVRT